MADPTRWNALVRRSGAASADTRFVIDLSTVDLPCPWCQAPTSETDPRCPSCGRRFGS